MPTTRQFNRNSKFNVSEASRLFFPDFQGLKTWFELLRVKLYRNDQKGKQYYFKLVEG